MGRTDGSACVLGHFSQDCVPLVFERVGGGQGLLVDDPGRQTPPHTLYQEAWTLSPHLKREGLSRGPHLSGCRSIITCTEGVRPLFGTRAGSGSRSQAQPVLSGALPVVGTGSRARHCGGARPCAVFQGPSQLQAGEHPGCSRRVKAVGHPCLHLVTPRLGLVTKRAGVHRATRSSPMTAQERVMAGLAEAERPEAQAPPLGCRPAFSVRISFNIY